MSRCTYEGMDQALRMSRKYAEKNGRVRSAILCSCDSYALKVLAGPAGFGHQRTRGISA